MRARSVSVHRGIFPGVVTWIDFIVRIYTAASSDSEDCIKGPFPCALVRFGCPPVEVFTINGLARLGNGDYDLYFDHIVKLSIRCP
jgi:hypothetical protein